MWKWIRINLWKWITHDYTWTGRSTHRTYLMTASNVLQMWDDKICYTQTFIRTRHWVRNQRKHWDIYSDATLVDCYTLCLSYLHLHITNGDKISLEILLPVSLLLLCIFHRWLLWVCVCVCACCIIDCNSGNGLCHISRSPASLRFVHVILGITHISDVWYVWKNINNL